MKKTTLLIAFSFILGFSNLNAQDTIPSCLWGISQNTGNRMLSEYAAGDSVFTTLWDPNDSLLGPRAFAWYYYVSNDTVKFVGGPYCNSQDTGVYTFKFDTLCAMDRVIFTLVSESCANRYLWYNAFKNGSYPCYERINPIENTCWAIFDKFTGEYTVKEFKANNEVYETGYDNLGSIIAPRQQNGWYYNNYDTLTFVAPAASACGLDSGIYRVSFGCDVLVFFMVNDPCSSRVSNTIGAYENIICYSVSIGIDEEISNQSIQIYPNPTSSTLTIEHLSNSFDENTQIVLSDLLGNKLLEEIIGQADNTYSLNVGHLSAGVYILQLIEHNTVMAIERVVINQ